MSANAYEELVERSARACRKRQFERTSAGRSYDADVAPTDNELDNARAILAEVLRTLETVTPEMELRGIAASYGLNTVQALSKDWLAMLRASPLAPKGDGR